MQLHKNRKKGKKWGKSEVPVEFFFTLFLWWLDKCKYQHWKGGLTSLLWGISGRRKDRAVSTSQADIKYTACNHTKILNIHLWRSTGLLWFIEKQDEIRNWVPMSLWYETAESMGIFNPHTPLKLPTYKYSALCFLKNANIKVTHLSGTLAQWGLCA